MPIPTYQQPPAPVESRSVPLPIKTTDTEAVQRVQALATPAPTPAPVIALPAAPLQATDHNAVMAAAGIAPGDYFYVEFIFDHESGFCPTKWQGETGGCPSYHGTPTSELVGYGLCQSTPAWKMAAAGADWATNPVTQLRWCAGHADEYGGWYGSYEHWLVSRNW